MCRKGKERGKRGDSALPTLLFLPYNRFSFPAGVQAARLPKVEPFFFVLFQKVK
ncbi:hypothetical protein TPADAL_0411a [Treponema pallidum subsp. pallidum DAL-1]|uniref:Uncharacterized protein n=2 Tax=Treponema pallidum TaxID=160 RepID=A0AAU8S563_TREPL|nr:hypothetical protein TPESAMD_0411a [Treponema pallidum subsp. pertenue str. SamoaD]AEZ58604.1 hypothetical protein TPECDC2_0411a [Treponema pallidum subsp. pertenue str. CDC2]AEZ59672.1 hypothetical protein TPEGAU_0411a [Treponema pallidum subsp. pertenue str. Gauthier]AEZ60736.1 hypothetical protein TPADAL_0411a [Treponema pallidum subsp. pallidum DAL-1]AGK84059.1 hypothetical protein TPFB_0411a [Treponema pallidum str. Fribourg-Blanc]AJB40432.1 hypothetical protein TENDBA_0411a [Treponema